MAQGHMSLDLLSDLKSLYCKRRNFRAVDIFAHFRAGQYDVSGKNEIS